MIVVTGGAGFIGSNLLAGLETIGARALVVCDRLGGDADVAQLVRSYPAARAVCGGVQVARALSPHLEQGLANQERRQGEAPAVPARASDPR